MATRQELTSKANITYLSLLLQQLVQLRNETEADEYGTLRASEFAFDTACGLLNDAAVLAALEARTIPYGCASTDSQGGVRIEWTCPTSSARLVVPSSMQKQPYVYHEIGNEYGTEAATPEALARWLRAIDE